MTTNKSDVYIDHMFHTWLVKAVKALEWQQVKSWRLTHSSEMHFFNSTSNMKNLILKVELFKNKNYRKKNFAQMWQTENRGTYWLLCVFIFHPILVYLKKIQNPLYSQATKSQLNIQRFQRQEFILERRSNN